MLLRKYMCLLGVGSAKIDLIIEKDTYKAGDTVHGHFLLKGGTISQQLKRIDCDLVMEERSSKTEKVVESAMILTSKTIESEEMNKVKFTFSLPEDLVLSSKETAYHFKTKLTFNEGVDSTDSDRIKIIE
ncbi:sporulation protein [Peribacillus sp. SCS-26]|uniref:sporulation protein n=1 Tax=Paraperibacillus marinus TaxID=3115295 RepID=UPI00390588CC